MSQIPTAEELFLKNGFIDPKYSIIKGEDCIKFAVEFAKLHVKAALEAVSKTVEIVNIKDFEKFYIKQLQHMYDIKNTATEDSSVPYVIEESILNAYPLENIK